MKKEKKYIPKKLFDEYDQGEIEIEGIKFRVRLLEHLGRIDFGMDEHFDRWANSTDFSMNIPRNEKQWNKKIMEIYKNISKVCEDYSETMWI